MKSIVFLSIGLFFFSSLAFSEPACRKLRLTATSQKEDWVRHWESVRSELDNYVFAVSHGFLGEINPAFRKMALFRPAKDQRSSQVIEIHINSRLSIEENSKLMYEKLIDSPIYQEQVLTGKKPLVFVVHSYASPVLMKMLVENSELIAHLRAAYTLQGAFGGSHFANIALGKEELDHDFAGFEKYLFHFGVWLDKNLSTYYRGAVESLVTPTMQKEIASLVQTARKDAYEDVQHGWVSVADALDSRLFYIAAAIEASEERWFRYYNNLYLSQRYGDNDGVILLRHQYPSCDFVRRESHKLTAMPEVMCFGKSKCEYEVSEPAIGSLFMVASGMGHNSLIEHEHLSGGPINDDNRRIALTRLLYHLKGLSKESPR